jgi:hypothetical protein
MNLQKLLWFILQERIPRPKAVQRYFLMRQGASARLASSREGPSISALRRVEINLIDRSAVDDKSRFRNARWKPVIQKSND